MPKTRKSKIAVFKCWSLIFFYHINYFMSHQLHELLPTTEGRIFYMLLQILVCFKYCSRLDDVPLSIRLSFRVGLTLSCFLSSRYTSHCSMRWSIVGVVLHRSQSGWFPLVSTYLCAIFVYPIIIFDITTWSRSFKVAIIFMYKSLFMVSSRGFIKVFHSLFQRCLIFCLVGK